MHLTGRSPNCWVRLYSVKWRTMRNVRMRDIWDTFLEIHKRAAMLEWKILVSRVIGVWIYANRSYQWFRHKKINDLFLFINSLKPFHWPEWALITNATVIRWCKVVSPFLLLFYSIYARCNRIRSLFRYIRPKPICFFIMLCGFYYSKCNVMLTI